jgi:hypothetical protein
MNEELQKAVNNIFLKIEDGLDLEEGRLAIFRAIEENGE